ncbi:hypothetical protein [Kaarinaea lacus]
MNSKRDTRLPSKSTSDDVNTFLAKVRSAPKPANQGQKGRLIFALDATASREPTWDHASHLQAEMFSETAGLGGLEIQLCYYRGFEEFHASPWFSNTAQLLKQMTGVRCLAGHTQINKVMKHGLREAKSLAKTKTGKINALVFIGDCVEEDIDRLGHSAGQLGLMGIPVFIFQEGHDPIAAKAFQQIARLSKGAYCPFDAGSARQLKDLLSAVAVFAAGGHKALENFHARQGSEILKLTKRK